MNHRIIFAALSAVVLFPVPGHAGPGKESAFGGRRVLFIGIDGTRADAVAEGMTRGILPNLKALSSEDQGLLSRAFYAGGELGSPTHQETSSGPGWSSLLTGVWANRHHVLNNRFLGARFQTYSHFMKHVKEVGPDAFCASFTDWPPIHDLIADGSRTDGKEFLDVKFTREPDGKRHFVDNPEKDIEIRDAALTTLRTQNPDAMFVYFGQVDEFGHGAVDSRASFSPDSALYLNAISHVDSHIGELIRAMRARPKFAEEDWLIFITTDHGGRGNAHGGDSENERNIWLIAHGAHLPKADLLSKPTPQTALVPLIYAHLGITPKPEWNPEPPPDLAFKVEVNTTAAPQCETFAKKAKAIVEEWYPKINEVLFDKDHPLPTATVRLTFEPMKGVAHATTDGIHISEEWVTKKAPKDYGMVVHELTHVVQDYKGKGDGWLTEGIADYVRHKFFEKDVDKLAQQINPDKSSYKQAYTIAAAFLFWLEQKKDKDIVHKLNAASHDGTYKVDLFKQLCGADVDALWKEFTDSLRAARKP